MQSQEEKFQVITDREIRQRLAGYKSAFTKRLNAAVSARESIEAERDAFIMRKQLEFCHIQRKQIQKRAGYLSWITRRANSNKTVAADPVEKNAPSVKEGVKGNRPSLAKLSRKPSAKKSRMVEGVLIIRK